MMMLHLNGSVKLEMVDKLMDAIDKCNEKPGETLTIYLNSKGGDAEAMEALIHIVNEYQTIITLVAYGCLQSAAFMLFFRSNCKRIVLPATQGMCHYFRIELELSNADRGYYTSDRAGQEWIVNENKQLYKYCKKLGFTAKELNDLKKTEEVFFTDTRLNELLEYQNAG